MALEELHDRLQVHFKRLLEPRPGGRAFLIEHPLSKDELSSLRVLLRAALQRNRWEHTHYWNQRYLPVLVAAAEVGYRYEGAGTAYWAHLEEWLDCPFDHDERHTLSRYYKSVAEWSGVTQPDTPWARQFCHISWPIAHAVFPVALHQPLFQAVLDRRRLIRPDTPAADFLTDLRGWAARRDLVRLVGFFDDDQVACDIVKAFLFKDYCPQRLSEEAMSRFRRDLNANRPARSTLGKAIDHHSGIRVSPPTPEPVPPPNSRQPPPRRFGTLVLVDGGDGTSLYLEPPPLAEGLRDEALRLLRSRRVALRFLEGGARLHPANLLGGARLPLTTSLPLDERHQEHPILAKLSDVDLDSTQLRLNLEAMVVDLRSPVLLSDEAGAEGEARQVRGRFVRRGGSYRLLFPAQLPLPPLPPSIARRARVAGMDCLQVADVDEPAMDWLAPWGFDGVHRPTLRLVGHPTVERRGDLSAGLTLGDTLALDLSGGPMLEEGEAEPLQDGLWLVALPGTPGDLRLRLRAPDGPVEEVQVRVSRRATHRPPLVRASLEGAGHTVDALRTGQLALRLDADLPLEGLSCAVKLRRGGAVLARAHAGPLPALPTVVSAEHPIWAALRGALDDAGADPLDLEVHVGALAVQRWRLEPVALGVWWHETHDGEVQLATELSGATARAWRASSPLQATDGWGPADAGVRLLEAVDEAGVAASGSGVCVGPSVASLGGSAPARPARLFRALSPTQDTTGAGALSLVQAWQRWHLASATSLVVDWQRREVVAALSRWGVECLCGEAWAAVEAACAGEAAGQLEVDLAAALRAAGIGVDTYVEDVFTQQVGTNALDLIKRAIATELARSGRLLTEIEAGDTTTPSTMTRLAEVMERAYKEVAALVARDNPGLDLSEAESDCYIDDDEADAVKALLVGLRSRREFGALIELVYPPGAAEELASWSYVGLDAAALSAELTRWLTKVRRGAPVRWELPQVGALLELWLHPAAVSWGPATLIALEAALQDRFGARAIRYVALRAAAALQGGAA